MFSREYISTLLILVEFLEKGHEIYHFWTISHFGTGTQKGVVPVPLNITKMVPVPLTRKGLVLVPNQVVLVPMLLAALIFVFLHC